MKLWLRGLLATGLLIVASAAVFVLEPLWVNDQVVRGQLWRQHVASRFVDVDGYRIHYFEATAPGGGGKPLVLIHGLGSRGEDWTPMIPGLAAHGFHVYAPDLPGYGRSPQPDVDYSIAFQENAVDHFMQAEGLTQADIGGWSMGGWVAAKLALDHPEKVHRLVLYDAAGVYFPPTFDPSLFTPQDAGGLAQLMAMLTPAPKPMAGFVSRAVVRRLHANAWVIDRSVAAMESGKELLDFRLHEIRQPTLVVWGGEDRLIPLAAGLTMHHDIRGSSMLVVAGCGHLAPGECSRPVLKGTLDFLNAEPAVQGAESVVPGR